MNEKLEWYKFKRWSKKIEKNGIIIKRSWGKEDIKMYRECQGLFDSPYIKTCFNYWKDVFRNSTYLFRYNRRVCFWDYYDLYSYLIINLTIKGVYFAKFGISTEHKNQAHECWLAREKLIKSYFYDVMMFSENRDNEGLKKWYENEVIADEDAFNYLGKHIKNLWD